MEPPALLALALGTLGVIAALPPAPSPSPLPSPSLSWFSHPELGTPFNVTCSSGVRADAFSLRADGAALAPSLSRDGRRATATLTVNRTGAVRLSCAVRAGGAEASVNRTVHVYYVPEPVLNVTGAAPAAGAELRGFCWLPPGATKDAQVRVVSGRAVVHEWAQPPLPFALALPEEQDELELSCQAELGPLTRSSSLRIPLLAKPRLDASGCPGEQNWTEGVAETLRCRARGRPQPEVGCSKDGNSLPVGTALPARPHHAGVYRCRAANALGAAERNVTVWVTRAHHSVPLLPVLLGTLFPALALLTLATLYLLHRRRSRIRGYWLWKRQAPPQPRAPAAAGASGAAPNGSAAP